MHHTSAKPCMTLAINMIPMLGAPAQPMVERESKAKEPINTGLRPNRSLALPKITLPVVELFAERERERERERSKKEYEKQKERKREKEGKRQ